MKWDEENERICLEGDGIRKVFSSVRNFFRRSTQAAFDAEYLEAMENKTYTPELFTVADIEEFAATLPIKLLPVWEQRILLESKEVAINGGNQNGKSGQLFIWKEVAPTASKIAIALGISVKTVEKHLAEIKKLWKAWKASQQV